MGKIADISHHNTVDWSKAKDELDLAIIRVQYGSTMIDTKYKEFVAGCKQYGIPFGHYAYCRFVSVNDAIVEAKDFLERADSDAKFLVADVEEQTCKNPDDLIPATQAFIDTLKAAGWKVGLYTGHFFYNKWGMDKAKADFLWIPRYKKADDGQPTGAIPDMDCDLWQYTEKGAMSGVSGNVDLNMLMGDKSLDWYTGSVKKQEAPKEKIPGVIAVVRILVDNLYAVKDSTQGTINLVPLIKGNRYNVTANVKDYHCLIVEDGVHAWVRSDNGRNFELIK